MLLNAHIKEYNPPVALTFVKKWKEYDDVYSFLFKPEQNVEFLAGQNARVVVPGLSPEVAARSLSMASTPSDEELLYAMHTGSGSPYKKAMLALEEGQQVHLVKVKGETFLPKDPAQPVILIAGGIGVTPFRSIAFDIAARSLPTSVTLVHVARGEYLYEKELRAFPHEQYRIRRNDIEKTLQTVAEQRPDAMYYVAGPPPFIESIKRSLLNLEISEFSILASKFTGYENLFE